jgi:hypothetical protein
VFQGKYPGQNTTFVVWKVVAQSGILMSNVSNQTSSGCVIRPWRVPVNAAVHRKSAGFFSGCWEEAFNDVSSPDKKLSYNNSNQPKS